jgi:hypothetical protein
VAEERCDERLIFPQRYTGEAADLSIHVASYGKTSARYSGMMRPGIVIEGIEEG